MMKGKGTLLMALMLISVLAGVALASPTSVKAAGSTYYVSVGGHFGTHEAASFEPRVLVIFEGDTVVWTDISGPHTVTSANITLQMVPLFDSSPNVNFTKAALEHPETLAAAFGPGGLMPATGSYSLNTSILASGTYDYVCTIHPGMEGTITVTEAVYPASTVAVFAGHASAEDVTEWAYFPRDIVVPRNTLIVWVNMELFEPHTVTSEEHLPDGTVRLGALFDSSPGFNAVGEVAFGILGWAGPPFTRGLLLPAPYPHNTFSYTFTRPGVYIYYCKIHAVNMQGTLRGMVGTIIVLPSITPLQTQVTSLSNTATAQTQEISALRSQLATAQTLGGVAILVAIVAIAAAIAMGRRRGG